MESVWESIQGLKDLVSLRFIDPWMRNESLKVLSSIQIEHSQVLVCGDYIVKVEESYEKILGQLTPVLSECGHNAQFLQQELSQRIKCHEQELKQRNILQQQLRLRIADVSQELIEKDELIRQLNTKLEEKDLFIDQHQKENNQYLAKVEDSCLRYQRALQDSMETIVHGQEEINQLKEHIQLLQEQKQHNQHQSPPSHFPLQPPPSPQENSEHSNSLVQCSLRSSKQSDDRSQFEELEFEAFGADASDKTQNQEVDCEKGKTLGQMLNLSVEKEFKLRYQLDNEFNSIEGYSKENQGPNWGPSPTSQNYAKRAHLINNSIQMVNYPAVEAVKQFRLHGTSTKNNNNPYYLYFQIACQNVKIRSQHFEIFSSMPTEEYFAPLFSQKIPLHQWQQEIQRFLIRKCNEVSK